MAFARTAQYGAEIALKSYLGLFAHDQRGRDSRQTVADLYDELRPSLHGYLVCIGVNHNEADDVIQETFLRLFKHLEVHGRADNLRGWVFRVAHNLSVNRQKEDRRLVRGLLDVPAVLDRTDPRPNPEDVYLRQEQLRRLDCAVNQLTEQQKQCLYLRAEGLRYREIATITGSSVSSVAEMLERTLVRLSGALYE